MRKPYKLVYRKCKRCQKPLASIAFHAHRELSQVCKDCITEEEKKDVDKFFREHGPLFLNR